jgi:hypothetical protein
MSATSGTLSRYGYDPRARRYKDLNTGRYVSAHQVRLSVDRVIETETVKVRQLTQQFIEGTITLTDWQLTLTAELKALHVAMGLAANGGQNWTSPADLGYIGSLIRVQYTYLQDFALQIKKGEQALDGTLLARARLYTQAARGTYEEVRRRAARNGGVTLEKRELGGADHCPTCLDQAGLGWSPIGTLNAIGDSECKSNCHCTFIYS